VLPQTHVGAGLELAAALADENRATRHDVAVEALDAEPLCRTVAPVARASLTLLRCHVLFPGRVGSPSRPSQTRMSLTWMRVSVDRWPLVRRMPFRRFFLKTRILGPRVSPSTTPTTRALETNGAPISTSPPS